MLGINRVCSLRSTISRGNVSSISQLSVPNHQSLNHSRWYGKTGMASSFALPHDPPAHAPDSSSTPMTNYHTNMNFSPTNPFGTLFDSDETITFAGEVAAVTVAGIETVASADAARLHDEAVCVSEADLRQEAESAATGPTLVSQPWILNQQFVLVGHCYDGDSMHPQQSQYHDGHDEHDPQFVLIGGTYGNQPSKLSTMVRLSSPCIIGKLRPSSLSKQQVLPRGLRARTSNRRDEGKAVTTSATAATATSATGATTTTMSSMKGNKSTIPPLMMMTKRSLPSIGKDVRQHQG